MSFSEPIAPRQFCPICSASVEYSPRYPDYVCRTCHAKAADAKGRQVLFYNESMSGGCVGTYTTGNGEVYHTHLCYIDGIECSAQEAYMGGIVIRPVARI